MHMADALLSPEVGTAFIVASGVTLAVSAKKLSEKADDRKVPLMGVMGAFVFAAQMINFTIPGTGSSGHLGGGILLMMLLGPYAAFITLASVLIVQALFFADGGILALGTNIWNLGFYTCFGGWIIYKAIAGKKPSHFTMSLAVIVGTILALEAGAFSVVVETVASGRSELPFGKFSLLMLGIHLPISMVEAVVTIAIVNFVFRVRPEIVKDNLGLGEGYSATGPSYRPVLAAFVLTALLVGGVAAWFASAHPDGLEWSIAKTTGKEELSDSESKVISKLGKLQEGTSFLPDYGFKSPEPEAGEQEGEGHWPDVSAGTTVSGLTGSVLVLMIVGLLGLLMVKLRGKRG